MTRSTDGPDFVPPTAFEFLPHRPVRIPDAVARELAVRELETHPDDRRLEVRSKTPVGGAGRAGVDDRPRPAPRVGVVQARLAVAGGGQDVRAGVVEADGSAVG